MALFSIISYFGWFVFVLLRSGFGERQGFFIFGFRLSAKVNSYVLSKALKALQRNTYTEEGKVVEKPDPRIYNYITLD